MIRQTTCRRLRMPRRPTVLDHAPAPTLDRCVLFVVWLAPWLHHQFRHTGAWRHHSWTVERRAWCRWQAICYHLDTTIVRVTSRREVHVYTRTLVETRAPASRHTRAAALSNGNPRRPKTPSCGQAARWWPQGSSRRPHWQLATHKGKGHQRRLRSNTRKS